MTTPSPTTAPLPGPVDFHQLAALIAGAITILALVAQLIGMVSTAAGSSNHDHSPTPDTPPITFTPPPGATKPWVTDAGGQILVNGSTVGMTMTQVRTVTPSFPEDYTPVYDETGQVLRSYVFDKATYLVTAGDDGTVKRIVIPVTPQGLRVGETAREAIALYGDPVHTYRSSTNYYYAVFTAHTINGTAWVVEINPQSKKIHSIALCGCLRQMAADAGAEVPLALDPTNSKSTTPARQVADRPVRSSSASRGSSDGTHRAWGLVRDRKDRDGSSGSAGSSGSSGAGSSSSSGSAGSAGSAGSSAHR